MVQEGWRARASRRAPCRVGNGQGHARGQCAESGGLERDRRRDRSNGRDRRAARPGRGRRGDPGQRGLQLRRQSPRPSRRRRSCDAAASPAARTAMPPAPAAAKIAAEDKIDLASIAGSGKRGQVLKGDVLAAVAAAQAPAPAVVPAPLQTPASAPRSGLASGSGARSADARRPMTAPAKSGCA